MSLILYLHPSHFFDYFLYLLFRFAVLSVKWSCTESHITRNEWNRCWKIICFIKLLKKRQNFNQMSWQLWPILGMYFFLHPIKKNCNHQLCQQWCFQGSTLFSFFLVTPSWFVYTNAYSKKKYEWHYLLI